MVGTNNRKLIISHGKMMPPTSRKDTLCEACADPGEEPALCWGGGDTTRLGLRKKPRGSTAWGLGESGGDPQGQDWTSRSLLGLSPEEGGTGVSGVTKEGNSLLSNHSRAESPGVSQRGLTGQASQRGAPNQNRFSAGARAGPSDCAVTTKGQCGRRGAGCMGERVRHTRRATGLGRRGEVTGRGAPP